MKWLVHRLHLLVSARALSSVLCTYVLQCIWLCDVVTVTLARPPQMLTVWQQHGYPPEKNPEQSGEFESDRGKVLTNVFLPAM